MGFYGKEKTSDYFKKTKILEMISSDEGHFRLFSTAKTISIDTPILVTVASPLEFLKEKHLPTLNMLYQLHDIWGIDVIRLKRADDLYKVFTSTPSISTTNLIDLYGVKYVISVTPIEKDRRFELIYSRLEGLQGKKKDLLKENTIKLYRDRKHFPRAWLVKDFRIMDSRATLYTMIDKKFDPRKEVLLEEEPIQLQNGERGMRNGKSLHSVDRQNPQSTIGNPNSVGGLSNEVEFIVQKNNELHLRVKAKENALLVLSDTYYPGWKAFVDGEEVKIYRANYNFRAIPLKPGGHEIKFVYNPISFKIGMLMSLFTLVGVVVYFVRKRRRVS